MLFSVEPRANFLTFGLISRDFEFIQLDLQGNICNFTNGQSTITDDEKNNFFSKLLLFNATITNPFMMCTQFFTDRSASFQLLERFFQIKDDRIATCCNIQGDCKIYHEPFIYQVSQYLFLILKMGLIGILSSYVGAQLLRYDLVISSETFVTNNFDTPDASIFNILPKLRIIPLRLRNFFLALVAFTLIFSFSLLNTLLPTQWPETTDQNTWNLLQIDPAKFSFLIISSLFILVIGTVKLIFKFMTKEHYQSYFEKVFAIAIQFIHILFSIIILNVFWAIFIPENSIIQLTVPWVTRIIFCLFGSIYAFLQIKYFDFFFHSDDSIIIPWKYYFNIHITITIESIFAYFLFTMIYYCSNVLVDYIWYNMVVVLIYPTSLSIYIAVITVFLIIYELLSKFQKLFSKVKELIVSNCPLKDINEVIESQKPSVLKIQNSDENQEKIKYLIPLKWKYFYTLCDLIDFRYAFIDAIKSAIIQLTIISIFFMGILVFIPPSFEGLFQLGLTTLLPLIPRLASTVIGTTSSLEDVVILNRFKMSISKLTQDLFKLERVDDRDSYEPIIICLKEIKNVKVE